MGIARRGAELRVLQQVTQTAGHNAEPLHACPLSRLMFPFTHQQKHADFLAALPGERCGWPCALFF